MALFRIVGGKTEKLAPVKVRREREVQRLFEQNLDELLEITFLASEHPTSFGGRIDKLGIDRSGAPVIIEYKRGQNDNVINQGLSYLRWLLDHRSDFEALVQRTKRTIAVDWSSPRVLCIAESFSRFDLDTAAVLPMRIELLRYRWHVGDLLLLEPEVQRVALTDERVGGGRRVHPVRPRIVPEYRIADHLARTNTLTRKLYEALREQILSLDDSIVEEPKAKYIAYKLTTNIIDVVVQRDALKVFLNVPSGALEDPEGLARDLTKPKRIGHWGNGDYEVRMTNEEQLDDITALIVQSYERNR